MLKRFISIILCCITLLGVFSSCSGEDEKSGSAKAEKRMTLMVYMVGSDLEAKGGSATADLEEMAESGIDLEKNNLVVFTGGSPKWHNDNVTEEEHYILELTKEGFENRSSMPISSMGEASTLTDFLDYAYKNYPAKEYALVMWDHGNGPVIGYGKDMLYGDDSLTLLEMRQALSRSPFSSENKLSFVGFDACLMASAELATVWSEYAAYLVASQETEPSFGWNYSFLCDLSESDIPVLLEGLTQKYMSSCEEYYEKKGFSNRDTTLSCFDLSKTDKLNDAISALFARAGADVSQNYNVLTARRVETRALGRASTGSEYDLVDLLDMTQRIADIYTEEAKALEDAISEMVITNTTNAEALCGMSLYYPFFNKNYYQKDWKKAYNELGLYPEYLEYLEAYAEVWLRNDYIDKYAKSTTPVEVDAQTFTLTLTPEQSASYASARYYVLQREREELFSVVSYGSKVTKNEDVLTASFDGTTLYAKDNSDNYILVTSVERDTVGDVTRYTVPVNAATRMFEENEYLNDLYWFELAANNSTKEVSVSSVAPHEEEETMRGGKLADADFSKYTLFQYMQLSPIYMTRNENGTIKPISEWVEQGAILWREIPIADFDKFTFAPLKNREYFLLFEICDTQGNKYCSELLPIENAVDFPEEIKSEPVSLNWNDEAVFSLGSYEGVELSMTVSEYNGENRYYMIAANTNSFPVLISCSINNVNGGLSISSNTGIGYTVVDAGETYSNESGMSFDLNGLSNIDDIYSIQFNLHIINEKSEAVLVNEQIIDLILPENKLNVKSEAKEYNVLRVNLHANEQVIYDKDGVKVTLIGMGAEGDSRQLKGTLKMENSSDKMKYFDMLAVCFDGVNLTATGSVNAPAGCTSYGEFGVSDADLDTSGIYSASELKAYIRISDIYRFVYSGNTEYSYCDIELSKKGLATQFSEGETVIFDEKDIRISVIKYRKKDGNNSMTQTTYDWYVTVVNNSNENYGLALYDTQINGEAGGIKMYVDSSGNGGNCVFAKGKSISNFHLYDSDNEYDITDLSAKIRLFDIDFGKIIYDSETPINFISNKKPLE